MSRVFLRGCAPSSSCDGRAASHACGGATLLGWWQPGVLLLECPEVSRARYEIGVVSREREPRESERLCVRVGEREVAEPRETRFDRAPRSVCRIVVCRAGCACVGAREKSRNVAIAPKLCACARSSRGA